MAPIYQDVHPSDPRFVRLMEAADTLRVPVLIHQGTTFCENVSLELANPVLLQPLALRFPELRMVIAHLGHPWIAETLVLIRKHRHLYSDISALYYRPWQFSHAPALEERERRAVPVPREDVERVSMTLPVLRGAETVLFLALGESKADAVRRAFAEPPGRETPASQVRSERGRTLALLDRDAAARLPS